MDAYTPPQRRPLRYAKTSTIELGLLNTTSSEQVQVKSIRSLQAWLIGSLGAFNWHTRSTDVQMPRRPGSQSCSLLRSRIPSCKGDRENLQICVKLLNFRRLDAHFRYCRPPIQVVPPLGHPAMRFLKKSPERRRKFVASSYEMQGSLRRDVRTRVDYFAHFSLLRTFLRQAA